MTITVKTQSGLEDLLAKELRELGLKDIATGRRMVSCEGELEDVYRINYCSRLALKVLVPILTFDIKQAKDVYTKSLNYDWHQWLSDNQSFVVRFSVFSDLFNNSLYGAQLLKDAIVDHIREKTGNRPSVELKNADISFDLYINKNKCIVSIDSSGEPLFKRNYKTKSSKAPLNEILASGLIQLAGWDRKQTLINPMCGSGTLLFEALFYAENRPPQFYRKKWSFQKWPNFDRHLFYQVKDEANEKITNPTARIIGLDNDPITIKFLRRNLRELELDEKVSTQMVDFFKWDHRAENAILIMNPPYDERMKVHDVKKFYQSIGDHLKQNFKGNTAWIITNNKQAMKSIGLKTSAKIPVFNGPLECRYMKYELFDGRLKERD
ncbi:MAG: class I SAM-dependent RNA methyltransferase [Saprospirales bacterium]|nr:MAG: class I SAM-dependent RNA methyltransferase [Saprospirales bacterium]